MVEFVTFNKNGVKNVYKLDNKALIDIGISVMVLNAIQDKVHANPINDALKPLINVLQDLAEPVSYGFMVKGFLQIMSGDDHAGQKTIKSAIGGFLGIQFIPRIFAVIKNIRM